MFGKGRSVVGRFDEAGFDVTDEIAGEVGSNIIFTSDNGGGASQKREVDGQIRGFNLKNCKGLSSQH